MKQTYKIHAMYFLTKQNVVLLLLTSFLCILYFCVRVLVSFESRNALQDAWAYQQECLFLINYVFILYVVSMHTTLFLRRNISYAVLLLSRGVSRVEFIVTKFLLLWWFLGMLLCFLFVIQRLLGIVFYYDYSSVAVDYVNYLYYFLVILLYGLYSSLVTLLQDAPVIPIFVFCWYMVSSMIQEGSNPPVFLELLFPVISIETTIYLLDIVKILVLIGCIFWVNVVLYISKEL